MIPESVFPCRVKPFLTHFWTHHYFTCIASFPVTLLLHVIQFKYVPGMQITQALILLHGKMECCNSFFSISHTSGYKQNCGIIISNSESKKVSLPTSKTAVCLLMLYYILGKESYTHTHTRIFFIIYT